MLATKCSDKMHIYIFLVGSGKKLLILTVKVTGTYCVRNNYNIFDLI
jgi:hypothetical protein